MFPSFSKWDGQNVACRPDSNCEDTGFLKYLDELRRPLTFHCLHTSLILRSHT